MREVCALAVLLAGALGDNHHREVLHVAKSRHIRPETGNPCTPGSPPCWSASAGSTTRLRPRVPRWWRSRGRARSTTGCLAYAALTVAQTAVDEARPEEAYRAATESLAAFRRGAPLPPVCVPDQVAALAVQAEAARASGRHREAGLARSRAVDLLRTTRVPELPEGSMPAGWGLPVVSARKQATLRAWVDAPW